MVTHADPHSPLTGRYCSRPILGEEPLYKRQSIGYKNGCHLCYYANDVEMYASLSAFFQIIDSLGFVTFCVII